MTVTDQARAFLAMALCGALLGAVYDALGALRRGRLLTAAADLLFGVLAANRLVTYRLEQLERKVDRHNTLVERMALVEKDVANAFDMLSELREARH